MDLGQNLVAWSLHAFVLLIYDVFFGGEWALQKHLCRLDNSLFSFQDTVPLNRDHAGDIVWRLLLVVIHTL